jgi:hypothetical protein
MFTTVGTQATVRTPGDVDSRKNYINRRGAATQYSRQLENQGTTKARTPKLMKISLMGRIVTTVGTSTISGTQKR